MFHLVQTQIFHYNSRKFKSIFPVNISISSLLDAIDKNSWAFQFNAQEFRQPGIRHSQSRGKFPAARRQVYSSHICVIIQIDH